MATHISETEGPMRTRSGPEPAAAAAEKPVPKPRRNCTVELEAHNGMLATLSQVWDKPTAVNWAEAPPKERWASEDDCPRSGPASCASTTPKSNNASSIDAASGGRKTPWGASPLFARQTPWGAAGGSLGALQRAMYHAADAVDGVVEGLCEMLEATIASSDRAVGVTDGTPGIATKVVRRVLEYKGCSAVCIVYGLIYLERLKGKKPGMKLTSRNCRVLLLLSFLTASKFCEDGGFANREWAILGNISLRDLNALELDFLFWLSFDLCVSIDEYNLFLASLLAGSPHEHKLTHEQRLMADPPAPTNASTTSPMFKLITSPLPSVDYEDDESVIMSVGVAEAAMIEELGGQLFSDLAGEFADSMPELSHAA